MYADYDPISLFERNSCFRVNIQTFSKNLGFQCNKLILKCRYLTIKSTFDVIFDCIRVFLVEESVAHIAEA
jgi:hypothetical protein